jgi:hypothetical protein
MRRGDVCTVAGGKDYADKARPVDIRGDYSFDGSESASRLEPDVGRYCLITQTKTFMFCSIELANSEASRGNPKSYTTKIPREYFVR